MRNRYLIMCCAALAALAGCAKDVAVENVSGPDSDTDEVTVTEDAPQAGGVVIKAVADGDSLTKTVLDGTSVKWQNGDAIAVSNGTSVARFVTDSPDGSSSAVFTTEAEEFASAGSYLAVYPWPSDAKFEDGKVEVEIPSVQKAVAGSFGKGANVAVASGGADNLRFKNVCASLKFTVPPTMTGLTKVVLSSNSGVPLAGKVSVNCSDAGFSIVDGATSVSLVGDFVPGRDYCLTVLPQTLSSGFTLEMTRGDKTSTMSTSKKFSFTRSKAANIGNLYDGTWKVVLEGPAVAGRTVYLTQTLEDDQQFACLENLDAGELRLRVLYENIYIKGVYSDGESVPFNTSSSEESFNIPSEGKYRIVLNKGTRKITIYSPDKDMKNKTVTFLRTYPTKISGYSQEITQLWIYGTSYYGSRPEVPKGEPYVLKQSLANPRLFVYKGATLPSSKKFKFLVSDNWNNEYAYGSGTTGSSGKDYIETITLDPESNSCIFSPLYAGQANNRYNWFTLPSGTNYIEVFIGDEATDENEDAYVSKKIYTPKDSYVLFAKK